MEAVDEQLIADIRGTHSCDERQFETKSLNGLLQLVKYITLILSNETQHLPRNMTTETYNVCKPLLGHLPSLIAVEYISKGVHKDTITLAILDAMKHFDWDEKAVLVLASFAMNHCLWMLTQMYSASSPVLQKEEYIALYMFLNSQKITFSDTDPFYFYRSLICSVSKRPKADQLLKPTLTKTFLELIEVVGCIIKVKELPWEDLQGYETPYEEAVANLPETVYQIVNIVIHCAAVINKFPSNDYDITEKEEMKLTSYARQLKECTATFTEQITQCEKFIDETKINKEYQIINEENPEDNTKALNFFINRDANQLHQNEAGNIIKKLKGKHVMLLVSDEKIPAEDLYVISKSTKRSVREDKFSILWIPLYSDLSKVTLEFHEEFCKRDLTWFTMPHPSVVSKEAADFIKKTWKFQSKTIIPVMLDPQGRVLNIDALDTLYIWGDAAFPFKKSKERVLWKSETFTMSFILYGVYRPAFLWILEKKYILVYGGDDIDWIREFTTSAKNIARKFNIPLELLYIGKHRGGITETRNNEIKNIITNEKLSYVVQDNEDTWFFWNRVRSMVISKLRQPGSETEDWVMRQVKSLLSYETERSWAILGKGMEVEAHGQGSVFMEAMMELEKEGGGGGTFGEEFVKEYAKARGKGSCCQVEFPVQFKGMPETLKCPNANCKLEEMERRIVFQCCHPLPPKK